MNERTGRCGSVGSLLLASMVVLAGCKSSGDKRAEFRVSESSRWLQASPVLQQQIDDEAARLPWTHGFERLEQIRWFASVGEPAYETLLELAEDPSPGVAAAALAALGATLDASLVPFIQDLDVPDGEAHGDLMLERARTLLRLGDWEAIPTLIRGLRDERLYTRSLCLEALKESTNETNDFDPRAEPAEREEGVARWERWWTARTGDVFLK